MWGRAQWGGSRTVERGERGLARDEWCTARVSDSGELGAGPLLERTGCTGSWLWGWLPSGAADELAVGSDG